MHIASDSILLIGKANNLAYFGAKLMLCAAKRCQLRLLKFFPGKYVDRDIIKHIFKGDFGTNLG